MNKQTQVFSTPAALKSLKELSLSLLDHKLSASVSVWILGHIVPSNHRSNEVKRHKITCT